MKTRFLIFFLAIVASVESSFADGPILKYGDLYLEIREGDRRAIVVAQSDGPDNYAGLTSVTIPDHVVYNTKNMYIERIANGAFKNCTTLKNITIEANLTYVGAHSFEGCTSLESISLPTNVHEIGEYAFANCTRLASVSISEDIMIIGPWAFANCTALMDVTIPGTVQSVLHNAFYNVGNVNYLPSDWTYSASGAPWGARMLGGYVDGMMVYIDESKTALVACSSDATGTLSIPNSVTSIHNRAFYGCNKLTEISIPNTVTKIWNNVFHGCTGLTGLTIPNSVTSIGNGAFENCSGLTSMTIPNSVTNLGDSAFINCKNLVSLEISDNVTVLGNKLCYNCSGLASFTIQETVTSIGASAFRGCIGLTNLTIPNSVTSIGDEAFKYCKNLQHIQFGTGISQMNQNVFASCQNIKDVEWNVPSFNDFGFLDSQLESITFGGAVLRIPDNICKDQSLLVKANLPDNVVIIGENAFSGCTNLSNIHFPEALQKIKSNAFENAPLYSITIPINVDEIGTKAFSGCNPTTVYWNADGTNLNTTNMSFGNQLEHVYFGDKVKVIHSNLFSNQTKITELYIPSGRIETAAFRSCSGLQSLSFGIGVTKICRNAFYQCTNISGSLVIPDAIDTIYTGAFDNCTKITSVTIGKNVKQISGFEGCTGIKTVYNFSYKSFVPHVGGVDNPAYYADRVYNNMDRQGDFLFSSNVLIGYTGNATDITLPATYKGAAYLIGSAAFLGATQLTTITLSDAVATIGSSAFMGCAGLTSMNIPINVTEIGQQAFSDCSNINEFSCAAQTPPTAYANSFENIPANATLYIPGGSRPAYESASGWSQFTNIVERDLVNVTGVTLNATTLTIAKKGEAAIYATISPSNASYKTVTWSSSNTNVATVTNGVVYGKNAGTATITCTTTDGGYTATCDVTVLAAEVVATGFKFYKYAARTTEVYVPYTEMNAGDTLTFMELGTGFITVNVQPYSVTNGEVNFIVEDKSILSAELTEHINFANSIRLKPLHPGITKLTISTTDGSNISQSVYIQITPDPTVKVQGVRIFKREITLAPKETDTLSVQVFPDNATNMRVNWASDDAVIASVLKENINSNRGVVTAKNLGKIGTVHIICTTEDGEFSDTCVVTVIKKRVSVTGLSLNQTSQTLSVGETLQLTPVFTPTDATNQNVYWCTDNDTIISMQNGLVQALNAGVDTVRCISEDGDFEAKCVIIVTGSTPPPVDSRITVRLDPTTAWSTVYLYAWDAVSTAVNGDWPGNAVTKDADGWWAFTFPENITNVNIIWNNGSGAQTVDINGVTASTCYKLNSKTGTSITVKEVDCDNSQAIDEIFMEGDVPQKVLLNGQILILRGDRTYTVTGQEVR